MYLLGYGIVTRSQIQCADACAADSTCKSFFFAKGQHENCKTLSIVLLLQSPNMVDLAGSAYYIMSKYPGLLFRGTVGIGPQFQMAAAWISAGPGTTTNTSCRNAKLNGCTKHYRHPLIDDWTSLNPQQLRYSVYKNEVEVAWVLFNATGSSKTNWFDRTRVLSSSYTDLTPSATYNAFALDYSYPNISRHFYVSKNWPGCASDNQWLCTYDNGGTCFHDNYASWPYILYSKLGQVANTGTMGNFDLGDCSTVTVVS